MKRVPSEDDHRSNVSAGGTIVKHKLTKKEKELCKRIGPKLVKDGLFFVGIDVINGMLVEVNVMSPGGITNINKAGKVRLQEKVIDALEDEVNQRNKQIERRTRLKNSLND